MFFHSWNQIYRLWRYWGVNMLRTFWNLLPLFTNIVVHNLPITSLQLQCISLGQPRCSFWSRDISGLSPLRSLGNIFIHFSLKLCKSALVLCVLVYCFLYLDC